MASGPQHSAMDVSMASFERRSEAERAQDALAGPGRSAFVRLISPTDGFDPNVAADLRGLAMQRAVDVRLITGCAAAVLASLWIGWATQPWLGAVLGMLGTALAILPMWSREASGERLAGCLDEGRTVLLIRQEMTVPVRAIVERHAGSLLSVG